MPIPPGDKVPQNILTWSAEVEKKIAEAKTANNQDGVTTMVITAPLTGGGSTGKLVFKNGLLVESVQST